MKHLFLFLALGLLIFNSCSKSDDDDNNETPENLAELIIGKWKYQGATCNGGLIIRNDGTWSWRNFEPDCNGDSCGYLEYGGTYTLTGDVIFTIGGPGEEDNIRGRIEISDNTFIVYDEDTNEVISTYVKVPECSD